MYETLLQTHLDGTVVLVGHLNWNSLHKLNINEGALIRSSLGADLKLVQQQEKHQSTKKIMCTKNKFYQIEINNRNIAPRQTHRHLEHIFLISGRGILQNPTLITSMEKILINRIITLGLGIHGNPMLGAISEEIRTSLKTLDKLSITPGGNGADLGIQGLSAHFETDLIVPFAGGTVGYVLGAFFVGDADHLLGDAGASHGGSEEVASLVDGVAFERLEDVVGDEVGAEVGHDAFEGAAGDGLGFDGLEVFVVLADVGAEGDDVEALFAEPFEDDGGVEAAGVGEDYLGFGGGGHVGCEGIKC